MIVLSFVIGTTEVRGRATIPGLMSIIDPFLMQWGARIEAPAVYICRTQLSLNRTPGTVKTLHLVSIKYKEKKKKSCAWSRDLTVAICCQSHLTHVH